MTSSQIHFAWHSNGFGKRFRTGVSLHSHTMHSREMLDFVPRIVKTIPVLRQVVAGEERRYAKRHGHLPDYTSAYWTPPVGEREVYTVERRQIEEDLGLDALVSLTDHDNIDAVMHLHLLRDFSPAPVSVEWTVPYGPSFFHLGVHNLAPERARAWIDTLAEFTAQPTGERLRELLAALHERPNILVVLNHPFWDEKGIGPQAHRELLENLLRQHGQWIHALEFNGMRPWVENHEVLKLAEAWNRRVISGGDRHCSHPNTVVNLTNASSFDEFVDEVRRGCSDVLALNAYRESYNVRFAESVWDIVREYPENLGRVHWSDRVFCRHDNGQFMPISHLWAENAPGIAKVFTAALRLMGSQPVRSTLRLALRAAGEAQP
jgi:peptidoglycan/xylan/chitin deacetylase (PgdA/CDA1 family)